MPGKLPRPGSVSPTGTSSIWILGSVVASLLLGWTCNVHEKLLPSRGYCLCSDNGNIYTVDELKPRVQCVFVKDSLILDTGSFGMSVCLEAKCRIDVRTDEIERRRVAHLSAYLPNWAFAFASRTPRLLRVDPQSIVVPGLADAHAHILMYGFMRQLPLAGTLSITDVVQRIKDYVLAHPDVLNDKTKWIEGVGWDQTKWEGAQFPTAADLDEDPLLKGRPISLSRIDVHARWVSPRVLELMGELPIKVQGGEIVRDAAGRPTGIFVDNAMQLIPSPTWDEQRMSEFFDLTMTDALAHGLTSIHDAMATPAEIAFFKKKAEEGKLPNRVYLMADRGLSNTSNIVWPYLTNHGTHSRLNVRSVKLFTDGALGSWGAALLEPYSDKPDVKGQLLRQPEELARLVRQFWSEGFQVNIHCIGDRANHVVLDILEDLIERENLDVKAWRPRIEHAQIFAPSDLERMGRLGIIASVQPTHATSDMGYAEIRLGPERIKGAYAYQTLLKLSPRNVLPLGSDFPVESVNPLMGFYAAVTRLYPDGSSPHGPGGWYAEERLTRAQALKGMTLDAAYASFAEDHIGSLTPGKKADLVVLNRDIMTVPFSEILGTKMTATVVDGGVVYGAL